MVEVCDTFFVYILQCNDRTLYTGITNDIRKRLKAHSSGKASKYTRRRLPVKLLYKEEHPTKSAALRRELEIKRLSRKDKIGLIFGE
jgi:putative endonuclease